MRQLGTGGYGMAIPGAHAVGSEVAAQAARRESKKAAGRRRR
jgi:hypothetical protein